MRERAQQSWPAFPNTAAGAGAAACSRSASAKTTLADLGRAGEADLRHVRVLDEPAADRAPRAGDDVQDALGESGVERELGEPQGGQGGELGGLEHDGVPAGERRAELPRRDGDWEVPGDDQADDAERLPERHVDAARDGNRLAEVLVDGAGVEVEDVRDHGDLGAGVGDRLADVPRLEARELLAVLLDERREPAEEACAVGGRDGTPGGEGGARGGDRGVRLLDAGRLELGDGLL